MKAILVFLLFSFSQNVYAQQKSTTAVSEGGGGSVGNGGIGFNAFLTEEIVKMYKLLKEKCTATNTVSNQDECSALKNFHDRIMDTKITSDYIVYGKIDHKPRDSINDILSTGEPIITYSIRVLKKSAPAMRRRVLLHEFMTLAKAETSDSYGFSTMVLLLLADDPRLVHILENAPESASDKKTFRANETVIWDGESAYPVLIQSTSDYVRFCVAKGFTDVEQSSLNDVSFSEWTTKNATLNNTAINSNGVVLLNDEGFIIQIQKDPSKKLRVIDSVMCK